jgi:HD superfamily phosphodiesterase
MSSDILAAARACLVAALKGKHNQFETRHPWRKDWEFAVLHSLRVEAYTLKILARESHALSPHEILLLRLAAILHDIARLDVRDKHAQIGANLASKWLQEIAGNSLEPQDIERVHEMIADHSNKDVTEQDFSKAVLKDADTLDEIGVMSIFMTSNWLEKHSPFFFHQLRERLIEFEIPFCERKAAVLNTEAAKQILSEKRAFLQTVIEQLSDELQADHSIEQMLLSASHPADPGSSPLQGLS